MLGRDKQVYLFLQFLVFSSRTQTQTPFLDCKNDVKCICLLQEGVVFVTCEDDEKVSDIRNLSEKFVRLELSTFSARNSSSLSTKHFSLSTLFRLEASPTRVSLTQTSPESSNGNIPVGSKQSKVSSEVGNFDNNTTSSFTEATSDTKTV